MPGGLKPCALLHVNEHGFRDLVKSKTAKRGSDCCVCLTDSTVRVGGTQVLESSREAGEPLSFEIGAGEIMGNPLYQVRPA